MESKRRIATLTLVALAVAGALPGAAPPDAAGGSGGGAAPAGTTFIATGPDSSADGYLELSPDDYGSWGSFAVDPPAADAFNPAGALSLQPVGFTAGFFLFVPDRLERELLSDIEEWQLGVGLPPFDTDISLERSVTSPSVASDTNGDGVSDTLESSFRVDGVSTALAFDLVQSVSSVGGVAFLRQEYTVTNEDSAAVDLSLVRTFDGDLLWSGDFANDEVGTTMHSQTLGPFVFQQEASDPGVTAVTLSGDGGDYYGGKQGLEPPLGPPPFGFGTDVQVWDAYGVPDSWRSYIAGVGYDTDGTSGVAPPGSTDPEDGFIGLDFPLSLGAGETTTVTVFHTWGQDTPGGCVLLLGLDSPRVVAGETLAVDFYLKHVRAETVSVPLLLRVVAADGTIVLGRQTPPLTIRYGDEIRRTLEVPLPRDLAPGTYRFLVGVAGMQQELATRSVEFEVVAGTRPGE